MRPSQRHCFGAGARSGAVVWADAPGVGQMSGNQRAAQCHQAMQGVGMECKAKDMNLVCFNAGGFPKPKCKDKCHSKGPGASYVQVG